MGGRREGRKGGRRHTNFLPFSCRPLYILYVQARGYAEVEGQSRTVMYDCHMMIM